jgi:DNA-binding CsgD family transcriptional regulator
MSKDSAENDKTPQEIPVLTAREQEIFNMLLDGKTPKEIAYLLKVKFRTVIFHQNNLYQKLEVHSINEFFSKYATPYGTALPWRKAAAAIFTRWDTYNDNNGSYINVSQKKEVIQGQPHAAFTFDGKLNHKESNWAGVNLFPDYSTLKAMKEMSSLSFTVLGDGNSYDVIIRTSDTAESNFNHYRKTFNTRKNEVSTFSFTIYEFSQVPSLGKPVQFIKDNIEWLQFETSLADEFILKVWNIGFHY